MSTDTIIMRDTKSSLNHCPHLNWKYFCATSSRSTNVNYHLRSWYLAHLSHGGHILFVKHNPRVSWKVYYVPVRIDSWNCRYSINRSRHRHYTDIHGASNYPLKCSPSTTSKRAYNLKVRCLLYTAAASLCVYVYVSVCLYVSPPPLFDTTVGLRQHLARIYG